MTDNKTNPESFNDFLKSFFYGSRTDLNFKFLADLSDDDAGQFFQGLFRRLSEAFDTNRYDRVVDHVRQWQIKGYSGGMGFAYDSGPFTGMKKPLAESRLALLTSGGHFIEGDDPQPLGVENMSQEEAIRRLDEMVKEEARLSVIPVDTPPDRLRVRHGGYDISAVQTDPNVAFPIAILRELEREGRIGRLHHDAFSFMGATSQLQLMKKTAPRWAEMLKDTGVEAVLLVPV